jgi:hypothetical protein
VLQLFGFVLFWPGPDFFVYSFILFVGSRVYADVLCSCCVGNLFLSLFRFFFAGEGGRCHMRRCRPHRAHPQSRICVADDSSSCLSLYHARLAGINRTFGFRNSSCTHVIYSRQRNHGMTYCKYFNGECASGGLVFCKKRAYPARISTRPPDANSKNKKRNHGFHT